VGVGIYSPTDEFLTDNTPTRMNTPTEDSSTNANLIKVNWDAITDEADTGRDPVIYYKLEWKHVTLTNDNWEDTNIPTGTIELTKSFSNDILNGTSYFFRVIP